MKVYGFRVEKYDDDNTRRRITAYHGDAMIGHGDIFMPSVFETEKDGARITCRSLVYVCWDYVSADYFAILHALGEMRPVYKEPSPYPEKPFVPGSPSIPWDYTYPQVDKNPIWYGDNTGPPLLTQCNSGKIQLESSKFESELNAELAHVH